jgi:hypothetical protein
MEQQEVSLEDFVRQHKRRNIPLEKRFKDMMEVAAKCNVNYVIVTRAQFKDEDIHYLQRTPNLTVETHPFHYKQKGWKITW